MGSDGQSDLGDKERETEFSLRCDPWSRDVTIAEYQYQANIPKLWMGITVNWTYKMLKKLKGKWPQCHSKVLQRYYLFPYLIMHFLLSINNNTVLKP